MEHTDMKQKVMKDMENPALQLLLRRQTPRRAARASRTNDNGSLSPPLRSPRPPAPGGLSVPPHSAARHS